MAAQDSLRQSEQQFRQLVETLPAMIDCATPEGEPIFRSQQLREYLGYNLDALDGTGKSRLAGTLDAGVHPDDLAAVKEDYGLSLRTGQPYARKHRLRRHDGEYRWHLGRARYAARAASSSPAATTASSGSRTASGSPTPSADSRRPAPRC